MADSFLLAQWSAPAGVHALTTTRRTPGQSRPPFDSCNLGLRNGDDIADVMINRQRLADVLSLPSPPRWLQQVHGTAVARIGPSPLAGFGDAEPIADAAVSCQAGTVLAILSADCLPVLFCSRDGEEVAAAHAGWRGLAAGVLEATLAGMRTPAAQMLVWLGPAAGPDAYEVGAEVRDAFVGPDPESAALFVSTRPGHWHANLYGLARRRLAAMGVASVHGGDRCTISEPELFYSHRRDQRTGRMATLIWRD